jgi:hypothetical protein
MKHDQEVRDFLEHEKREYLTLCNRSTDPFNRAAYRAAVIVIEDLIERYVAKTGGPRVREMGSERA